MKYTMGRTSIDLIPVLVTYLRKSTFQPKFRLKIRNHGQWISYILEKGKLYTASSLQLLVSKF